MDTFPINVLDFISLLVIILSGIISSFRGLVKEGLSIAAWVGAIFSSIYISPFFFQLSLLLIENKTLSEFLTYLATFIIVLITLSIIIRSLTVYVRSSTLNNLDKSLGFLFGIMKGLIILSVVLIIFDWFSTTKERPYAVNEAKLLPIIDTTSRILISTLPKTFIQRYNIYIDKSENILEGNNLEEKIDKLNSKKHSSKNVDKTDDSGYSQGTRRRMDRLFQSNQKNEEN